MSTEIVHEVFLLVKVILFGVTISVQEVPLPSDARFPLCMPYIFEQGVRTKSEHPSANVYVRCMMRTRRIQKALV